MAELDYAFAKGRLPADRAVLGVHRLLLEPLADRRDFRFVHDTSLPTLTRDLTRARGRRSGACETAEVGRLPT